MQEELEDGETIKSIELIELVDDSDDDDDPPPSKSVPKALEASEPSKSPNKTNRVSNFTLGHIFATWCQLSAPGLRFQNPNSAEKNHVAHKDLKGKFQPTILIILASF